MKYILNDDEIMGNDKTFLKVRSNGLMLSDVDVSILNRNNIDYNNCHNLEELIFMISQKLEDTDDQELLELSIKLGEYNYYNYTNK